MALNFLNNFKNTKTRTLVLVVGSTLVVGVVFLMMNLKGNDTASKENTSKVTGVPREAQSVPGTQTSEQYRKLLAEENKKRAEEAEKDKKSAIPTFKGADETGTANQNTVAGLNPNARFGIGGAGNNPNDPFGDTSRGGFIGGGSVNLKEQQAQLEAERQKRLDEQRRRLAEQEEDKRRKADLEQRRKELEAAEKQYQQSVQEAAGQMANYAKGATASWTTYIPQNYVQGVYADKGKNKTNDNSNAGSDTENTSNQANISNNNSQSRNAAANREIIKAGTVLYAVLDTAINSDEQGPVLATVVSGKYKGARLVGKISLPSNAKKVVISFSTMSLPKKRESMSVDAYAVDADTARTAFASDVDNHYLLRYGSLFASSFMEGFGKAVGQQGTTTTDPSGSQIQTKPKLDPQDQVKTALGTVGEKWGKQVEPLFKTPVTVTVDQGLGLGILFMRDADVSANISSTTNNSSTNSSTNTQSSQPIINTAATPIK